MIELSTLTSLAVATFFLALAPGPDNFFVLSQSILKGAKTGLLISLGLCSGLIFHTTLVGLGIATLIKNSELLLNTIKYFGVLYLLYLAIMTARSKSLELDNKDIRESSLNLFFKGVMMNILNPKVTIFFLAFFPQFINYEKGNIGLQLVIFSSVFILTAMAVFSMISIFSAKIGEKLMSNLRLQKGINYTVSGVYALLAFKLLFTKL